MQDARLTAFCYEASVEKAKFLADGVKRKTLELVRELYFARKNLEPKGRSTIGTFVPMVKSWQQYCEDIGLEKRTANRWLTLYNPSEDRMLTMDEVRQRLEDAFQDSLAQIRAHVGNPEWRPEGWTPAFELRYRKILEAEKLRAIAARESFDNFHLDDDQQLWLFDEPYLHRLSERVRSEGADLIAYQEFCMKVKSASCADVPIQSQVNVFHLVKAALEDFEPSVRPQVAKFVAELTVRDAAGEFEISK